MIDLHTHTLFSDGILLPSELVRRAYSAGYKGLAITDHVDSSNIDFVIPRIVKAISALREYSDLKLVPGAEITHVPPELIGGLVAKARELGAKLVVVHGETIAEPVAPGTNSAAIEAGADILAHPGLISGEDAKKAKDRNVALEITSRSGHSLTNGYVQRVAVETGATLVINTDAHAPEDMITRQRAEQVLRGAGVSREDIGKIFANSQKIIDKLA